MNVLITRPDERGQQLCEMLAEKQIFALHQPLFRVDVGRDLPQLPSLLARLNRGDYLFAVSKQAIAFAHQTLQATGFHWRNDLHYFAVGEGSACYFAGVAEQAVRFPTKFTNSEGLLALPEMHDLHGKTVMILRAETGRDYFAEQAVQRGATVQVVECYQRISLSDNMADKLSLAKRAGIDTIVATSSEILQALIAQTHEADRPWLLACRLVVVGRRLANDALRLGWPAAQIEISNKADNTSLLNTLLTHYQS